MEPLYLVARAILRPLLFVLFRFRIIGLRAIPRRGPAIIAPNHISNFDPLCVAYAVDSAGRRPRFLGKASLWKNPFLRVALDGLRQIPVRRGSGDAAPIEAALTALARGEVVVIYPEATITRNPDLTPMRGKTGVARLALATGVPVYPVGVWGAQWIAGKGRRMAYRGHRDVMVKIGDPMTFEDLAPRANDPEILRDVTDRVMAEVDRLVRELHKIHPDGGAVPAFKEDER